MGKVGRSQNLKPIKEIVEKHGVGNVLVLAELRPVRHILFIGYTSSNDEPVQVPCFITEKRYKVAEGYKVAIVSTMLGFGGESYYQTDFESLRQSGHIKVYVEQK